MTFSFFGSKLFIMPIQQHLPHSRSDYPGNARDVRSQHRGQPLAGPASGAHKDVQMAGRRAAAWGRSGLSLGAHPCDPCLLGLGMPWTNRPHQPTALTCVRAGSRRAFLSLTALLCTAAAPLQTTEMVAMLTTTRARGLLWHEPTSVS